MRHVYRAHVHRATPGERLELSEGDSHHLARVVRRGVGDSVELMTDDGVGWPAQIVDMGPPITVEVGADELPARPVLPIDVAVGLAEFSRLDLLSEKLTEVGVRSLTVFSSDRVRRLPGVEEFTRRRSRMERVAMAAAKQSGRPRGLRIEGLVPFQSVIGQADPASAVLVDPRGECALQTLLGERRPGATAVVVGPEAGFADSEIAAARDQGVTVAHLGGTVLRTETAALVAVVMVAHAHGHLLAG